jgi:exo-beta-1,3-glucanase (GH17 family)
LPLFNKAPAAYLVSMPKLSTHWRTTFAATSAGLLWVFAAAAAAEADLAWLRDVRFMAYTPSEFRVSQGKPIAASLASMAQDLRALRPYVDGLITYATASGVENVVGLAQEAGYRAVIIGIWSPTDSREVNSAIALAQQYPRLVRAIAVGNEGLYWKRYTWREVRGTIQRIRQQVPQLAVTTSEPLVSYLGTPTRVGCEEQDFLLPNIHPVFETWFRPQAVEQASEFVMDITERLYALCRKFVLVKETGLPSAPQNAGYSQAAQRDFWQTLLKAMQAQPTASVALFEAFDAPWKVDEIARDTAHRDEREGAWGWFTRERNPKAVVDVLTPRQGHGTVHDR